LNTWLVDHNICSDLFSNGMLRIINIINFVITDQFSFQNMPQNLFRGMIYSSLTKKQTNYDANYSDRFLKKNVLCNIFPSL